jgi:hypothetical protein
MKNFHALHKVAVLVVAGFLFSSFGRDITVIGTVVDTLDKPIEKAMVLLSGGISVIDTMIDTAFTGSDGKFEKKMTISDNARSLLYAVSKEGYATKTGQQQIPGGNDRVDLGTIVLGKGGPARKVLVIGQVVNARTSDPIEGALVILSEIGIGITDPPESTNTDREGNFEQVMEVDSGGIGSIRPSIAYNVSKEGFAPANGRERVQRDTLDLGEIALQPMVVPITNNMHTSLNFNSANRVLIYSLKGQLLYAGKPQSISEEFISTIGGSQPVFIHYKLDNTLLGIKKIARIR